MDDDPVRATSEEIARAAPGTAFVDRGVRDYDELCLEDLEHRWSACSYTVLTWDFRTEACLQNDWENMA